MAIPKNLIREYFGFEDLRNVKKDFGLQGKSAESVWKLLDRIRLDALRSKKRREVQQRNETLIALGDIRKRRAERIIRDRIRDRPIETIRTDSVFELYERLKNYSGQRLLMRIFDGDNLITSNVIEVGVPASRWFKRNRLRYFYIDSANSYLDGLANPRVVLTRSTQPIDWGPQMFREGITNCLLTPVYDWIKDKIELSKSKNTIKKYKKHKNEIEKMLEKYENGVPEEDITSICNELQIGISVELPFCKRKYVEGLSFKKPLKKFNFMNTRLNHIDLNEVVSLDTPVVVSEEEMKELYETNQDYCVFRQVSCGKIRELRTINQSYIVKDDFNESVMLFERDTGLDRCKLDWIGDEDLSKFVKEGFHANGTFDYTSDLGLEGLNHIDIEKAYATSHLYSGYGGFVGKITDFRRTDKIVGIGFYRIKNIRGSVHHKEMNVYPSVELEWLKKRGVSFDIVEGCWGSRVDFDFPDYMFEKNELGVKYYCKWAGCNAIKNLEKSYSIKGDLPYLSTISRNVDDDCRFEIYGNTGMFSFKKKVAYHLTHITAFMTAYVRMRVIEQLDYIEEPVRVCADGIYFRGDVEKLVDTFRFKDDRNLANQPGKEYVSYDDNLKMISSAYHREHFKKELFLGAGGNGKTHINLKDTGLVRMLYVAPSWKLARNKHNDYGIDASVWYRVFDETDENNYYRIAKRYNVLLIDEVSMMTEESKQKLFELYGDCKLILCGDVGFQLPPPEEGAVVMNTDGFDNIVELEKNYRFTCDKHSAIIAKVRGMIAIGEPRQKINEFIGKSYKWVLSELTDYKPEDIILCSRKKYCEEWSEKFDDINKWRTMENGTQYKNGEIVIGDKPVGVRSKLTHGFTIHSIQGETFEETIYIDMRNLFDVCMGYTAISRARKWEQIRLINI